MATVTKRKKIVEADQMVDQNVAVEPAQPATADEVAQAPAEQPAADPQPEVMADEEPSTVEVDANVQIPADQLAAAVAQATGDVVPAETAEDAVQVQEEEGVEQPMVAPEQQVQPAMESLSRKGRRMTEEEEDEPSTVGLSMKDGIDTVLKAHSVSLHESEEDSEDDGLEGLEEDMEDGVQDMDGDSDDGVLGEDVEEDAEEDGLPESYQDGDGVDDIDDLFSEEPDSDELLGRIEDFVNSDGHDIHDISDALSTTAAFLDQIADDRKLDFSDAVNGMPEDDEEEVEEGDDLPKDGQSEEDGIDDEFEDDIDDVEDDAEGDGYEPDYPTPRVPVRAMESRSRVRCTLPERGHRPIVSEKYSMKESAHIIYPAGSRPLSHRYDDEENLVARQRRVDESRRRAIADYRRSVLSEREERRPANRSRFNEALNSSVRSVSDEAEDPKAWSSNMFVDRYEESSKLNYKELLRNGFLG